MKKVKARMGISVPLLSFLIACIVGVGSADAKVYVDVTSPGVRKLPIAIQTFEGGKEISSVITDDLTFTGLFDCIDDAAQIERPEQPFNPANWKGLGVELVVKGRVQPPLNVTVSAYDVSDGREVLKKEYTATRELVRPLAHSIANDIYKMLTGQQGVFRTKVAYVTEQGGRRELYLADWDGHRSQGLGMTGGILLTPRWSRDGTKLLYSAERRREWGIFLLDISSMREKNIVALKGLSMSGNFFPDNREFVFVSSRDGNPDIYAGDTVGMIGRKIISSPWIDVSPAVAPDGRSIAFVSNRSGNPQIYLADRDGNGIRRLTFEGTYNTTPTWSPKGDKVAYVGMVGGRHQVFTIRPDGSGLSQLTDRGNNEEPSFSPDGRYIVFSSDRDGTKGLYLMRADGEGVKRITPKGIKATSPSWSPL